MTNRHDLADLPALEELGRRLDIATAHSRRPARRSRRTLALAAVGLALIATPAAAIIFDTPGTTIDEALPQVTEAIDRKDPAATGRELHRLGFQVRWQLIVDNPQRGHSGAPPTLSRDVLQPPPGTEVLAVLNSDGSNKVTADTRHLLIEIAPAGSEILRSHMQERRQGA